MSSKYDRARSYLIDAIIAAAKEDDLEAVELLVLMSRRSKGVQSKRHDIDPRISVRDLPEEIKNTREEVIKLVATILAAGQDHFAKEVEAVVRAFDGFYEFSWQLIEDLDAMEMYEEDSDNA